MASGKARRSPLTVPISLLFAVGFGGLPMWIGYRSLEDLPLAIRSSSFPSVEGEVVRSEVEIVHGRKSAHEEPRLVVRYRVDDRDYTTDRIHFANGWSTFDEPASTRIERTPVGSRVRVFYDPEHPARACLEPGIVWTAIAGLAFLLPFLLGSLVVAATPFTQHDEEEPRITESEGGRIVRFHVTRSHWVDSMLEGSFVGVFSSCCGGSCCAPIGGRGPGFAAFVWLAAFGTTVAFVARHQRHRREGRWDVILDRGAGTIRLPPTSISGSPRTVEIVDVEEIRTEARANSDSDATASTLVISTRRQGRVDAHLAIPHGEAVVLADEIRERIRTRP